MVLLVQKRFFPKRNHHLQSEQKIDHMLFLHFQLRQKQELLATHDDLVVSALGSKSADPKFKYQCERHISQHIASLDEVSQSAKLFILDKLQNLTGLL
jgi:hypothetical protein